MAIRLSVQTVLNLQEVDNGYMSMENVNSPLRSTNAVLYQLDSLLIQASLYTSHL